MAARVLAWELAAHWFRKAKNELEVQRCQLAAAEGLVSATEKSLRENAVGTGFQAEQVSEPLSVSDSVLASEI